MQNEIKIGNKTLGKNSNAFIIAEAGVNHNGDINIAKQLVYEAKKCGVDCVKFQTFKADSVVTRKSPKAKYQLKTTKPEESQLEMLKKLELDLSAHEEIIKHCKNEGIMFLSTPYNEEDVDLLDDLGVAAFKLPSICINEPFFLKYTARKNKPIILSTGMATLAEVDNAVRVIRETGNEDIILLQCTTNYPSRGADANLLAMNTLRDAFDLVVGYSDHTQNDIACIVSIGLGAKVIEKHFTIDKSLPGPDQSSSANPEEFSELVKKIRMAETVLGSPRKEPCEIEKSNSVGMRRSITARQDIPKGTVIREEMITLKRPATGISPQLQEIIIGKKTSRDISADDLLQMDMIEW